MEIIKELKSTYLSRPHYKGAKLGSLLFFTVCTLLSTLYWFHPSGDLLLAKGELVFVQRDFYRLLSSVFIHGDLKHLLSNSLMLLLLSYFVIEYYGFKLFTLYALSAGVLTNALTLSYMPSHVGLLGASGVVYFLWGFWLSLYVFIEKTVPLSRRIMKVAAVTLFLLVPSSFDPQVSYLAHGVGFGFGIFFGLSHFLVFKKKFLKFEKYRYILEYEDSDFPSSVSETYYPS